MQNAVEVCFQFQAKSHEINISRMFVVLATILIIIVMTMVKALHSLIRRFT